MSITGAKYHARGRRASLSATTIFAHGDRGDSCTKTSNSAALMRSSAPTRRKASWYGTRGSYSAGTHYYGGLVKRTLVTFQWEDKCLDIMGGGSKPAT